MNLTDLLLKWEQRRADPLRSSAMVSLEAVCAEVLADLQQLAGESGPARLTLETSPAVEPSDEWLTAEQCAKLLNVSVRWCYDHQAELGGKRLSRRCVRFSSRAVARRMARKSA